MHVTFFFVALTAVAAQECYMTADGAIGVTGETCKSRGAPRNDIDSDSVMEGSADEQVAGVRCCSGNDGASNCGGNKCLVTTWHDAQALCHDLGGDWDLCTVDQILANQTIRTGCQYDTMHVWTKTPCPSAPMPKPTPAPTPKPTPTSDFTCSDSAMFYQSPEDNVLRLEFEEILTDDDGTNWKIYEDANYPGYTGTFGRWIGSFKDPTPGGKRNVNLHMTKAGLHRFICRGFVNDTDSSVRNDFWIQFRSGGDNLENPGTVTDFFSARDLVSTADDARKYAEGNGLGPNGEDKTPYSGGSNPENDGYMKAYQDNKQKRTFVWKWRTKNSDADARDIFVEIGTPGVIQARFAARSQYSIDKCALYYVEEEDDEDMRLARQSIATNDAVPQTLC